MSGVGGWWWGGAAARDSQPVSQPVTLSLARPLHCSQWVNRTGVLLRPEVLAAGTGLDEESRGSPSVVSLFAGNGTGVLLRPGAPNPTTCASRSTDRGGVRLKWLVTQPSTGVLLRPEAQQPRRPCAHTRV